MARISENYGNIQIRICNELLEKLKEESDKSCFSIEGLIQNLIAEHYGKDGVYNGIEYLNDHRFEEVC